MKAIEYQGNEIINVKSTKGNKDLKLTPPPRTCSTEAKAQIAEI